MSRLRNVPETCPIYNEAKRYKELIIDELHDILNPNMTETTLRYLDNMLECTDRCRDISGELRGMCVERAEKIEELEDEIERLEEKVRMLEEKLEEC